MTQTEGEADRRHRANLADRREDDRHGDTDAGDRQQPRAHGGEMTSLPAGMHADAEQRKRGSIGTRKTT